MDNRTVAKIVGRVARDDIFECKDTRTMRGYSVVNGEIYVVIWELLYKVGDKCMFNSFFPIDIQRAGN